MIDVEVNFIQTKTEMILNTGISLVSNYTTQSYPEFLPPLRRLKTLNLAQVTRNKKTIKRNLK